MLNLLMKVDGNSYYTVMVVESSKPFFAYHISPNKFARLNECGPSTFDFHQPLVGKFLMYLRETFSVCS